MHTRVIALGQAAAGDDGVGFAVLEELRRRTLPAEMELVRAHEASALAPLLETRATVVLVDAVVGARPGEVLQLDGDDLASRGLQSVSSHGIGVAAIIELARLLAPSRVGPRVRIVAVAIARPDHFRVGLSPIVAAAVPRAADMVLELARAMEPCDA
jgi:hydrogenase maturation protease